MKERRCAGCNEIKISGDMIKLTKNYKTGEVVVNPDRFVFGRSLYVCKNENCVNLLFKKDRISKNLKKILSKEEKENIRTVLNPMLVVQH